MPKLKHVSNVHNSKLYGGFLAVAFSCLFLIPVFIGIASANPGTDFSITFFDVQRTDTRTYNTGETVIVYAQLQNTGDVTIDAYHLEATLKIKNPSGSQVHTATSWNTNTMNPGSISLPPDLSWSIPSNAASGWYTIEVTVVSQDTGLTRTDSKNNAFYVNPPSTNVDFIINLLVSDLTQYNTSDTAKLWARIENTGNVEIDTAKADYTVKSPSGATVFTGIDDNSIYLDPGQIKVFEVLWTIPDDAEEGLYDITVSITAWEGPGKSGQSVTKSREANNAFSVNAPPAPDYTLSISPSSKTITQGESATFEVTVTSLNGWTDPVTLAVSGLPSWTSGSFSHNPVTPTATSTLTITTSPSQSGQIIFSVVGTSGVKSHSKPATLLVQETSPSDLDFSLTASPSVLTAIRGRATETSIVTVNLVSGSTNRVDLVLEGLPSNVGAPAISPLYGNPPFTANLAFGVVEAAPTGKYDLNITGYGGGKNHSAPITLYVIAAPELRFSLGEQYYPANLYFEDWDVANNEENYPTQNPPPYYSYYHVVDDPARESFVAEYWYYYAFNYHPKWYIPEHEHDFERVYVWYDKKTGSPVYYVAQSHIGHIDGGAIDSISQLFFHVSNGSHGIWHNPLKRHWADTWESLGKFLKQGDFESFLPIDSTIRLNESQDTFSTHTMFYRTEICSILTCVQTPWTRDEYNNPYTFWDGTTTVTTHSPVTLHIYDEAGRHAGLNATGDIENGIPGVTVYNYSIEDETKWVAFITNSSLNYSIFVNATEEGNFSLDVKSQKFGEDDIIEFENVELTNNTVARISGSSLLAKDYLMEIDTDGDGNYEQNTTSTYEVLTFTDPSSNRSSTTITSPAYRTIPISASIVDTLLNLKTKSQITNGTVNITGYSTAPVTPLENNTGMYLEIDISNVTIDYATLTTFYSEDEVNASGLNESKMSFYEWDDLNSRWVKLDSNVNTLENYISANLTRFSYYIIAEAETTEDTMPPTITIASPTNTTYNSTSINLEVSADEAVTSWLYSLNGGANVSFSPNTTITATEGSNNIIVYATDSAGNTGSSTKVYFTVTVSANNPSVIHQYHWYADYDSSGTTTRMDGLVIGVIVNDTDGLSDISSVTVDATALGKSSTLILNKNPGGAWSDAHYMEALTLAGLNVVATSGTVSLTVTVTDSSGLTGTGAISVTIKEDIVPEIIHQVSWSDASGNTLFVAFPWDIGTSHISSVKLDASTVGLWDDLTMSYDSGWGGYALWTPITAGTFSSTAAGSYNLNIDVTDTSGYSGAGTVVFTKS